MIARMLAALATALLPQPGVAAPAPVDPAWRATTVYFLLTDRFANGDPGNDREVGRRPDGGLLRSYAGGDLKGLTQRIEQGWFNDLGVDAIWTTPLIENVHGSVVEGEWGRTYAFHGYWPKDFTRVDPNLGDEGDLAAMIAAAHKRGLRVIVDVIANHFGPETEIDPRWPAEWVRREPKCDYKSFAGTTACELAVTLQDIRTESEQEVALPPFLIAKWKKEGRLRQETAELDRFFARTGYPRTPRYYLVKWLTDWVRDYGVDGYRVDTAKHTNPEVWSALRREADLAIADWRARHPDRLPGDRPFYMVGEVFNHGLLGFSNAAGAAYDYGDRLVDFRDYGFDGSINMAFPTHLKLGLPALYQGYAAELSSGPFAGSATLSYLASHDDMAPWDPERKDPFADAEALLLAPGGAQIYYGDEIGRSLVVPGATGDATLRSAFNWSVPRTEAGRALLTHWQKLGRFRRAHPAIGAGSHRQLAAQPFTFARTLSGAGASDRVVVALPGKPGPALVRTGDSFADGSPVHDAYTGAVATVTGGIVSLPQAGRVILLEPISPSPP